MGPMFLQDFPVLGILRYPAPRPDARWNGTPSDPVCHPLGGEVRFPLHTIGRVTPVRSILHENRVPRIQLGSLGFQG